jgi:hypothetical protein
VTTLELFGKKNIEIGDIDDQVLNIWKRRKRKIKIGSRQRYM